MTPADLSAGWIYSNIAYNNLGTNFAVSQTGDLLFRHVITSESGEFADARAAAFGWRAVTPYECILTRGSADGSLPASQSLVSLDAAAGDDDDDVVVLNLKGAEDGRGVILRLWNMSDRPAKPVVRFNAAPIERVLRANCVEEDVEELGHTENSFQVGVAARSLATLRIITR